jgi:hypothetical protein
MSGNVRFKTYRRILALQARPSRPALVKPALIEHGAERVVGGFFFGPKLKDKERFHAKRPSDSGKGSAFFGLSIETGQGQSDIGNDAARCAEMESS